MKTDRMVSSPVTSDPNNSSVRILALGVEGPNETSRPRLLTLGCRTVIDKNCFNISKIISAGAIVVQC